MMGCSTMSILLPKTLLLLACFKSMGNAKHLSHSGIETLAQNECGQGWDGTYSRLGRVLGGESSKLGEFPWITSIQSSEGQHFCAGFMINSRFLISAAHCFCKEFNPLYLKYNDDKSVIVESMKVKLSRVNLSEADAPEKVKDVKQIIMHHGFDNALNNDIAIVELKNEVEWSAGVLGPICLPSLAHQDHEHGNVTVAGWGYRQCDSITPSDELHKVTVPLWTAEACKKSYKDENYNFNRENILCAGSDKKDFSKGDSGGPLMFMDAENRWTAIGIVSAGRFMCSDRVPGVYTKISSYLEWINSNTK